MILGISFTDFQSHEIHLFALFGSDFPLFIMMLKRRKHQKYAFATGIELLTMGFRKRSEAILHDDDGGQAFIESGPHHLFLTGRNGRRYLSEDGQSPFHLKRNHIHPPFFVVVTVITAFHRDNLLAGVLFLRFKLFFGHRYSNIQKGLLCAPQRFL